MNEMESANNKGEHPNRDRLLRASEIMKILNVSRTTAYRLMQNEIPSVKFGGKIIRVRLSDFEVWLQSRVDDHKNKTQGK